MKNGLTSRARELRKTMTEAERVLWYKLRGKQLGVKFRRQQPIGKYIVDFVSFEKKLVVEIDGGQHLENKKDIARDEWFAGNGFKVLRFWNHEVLKNIEGVLEAIAREIDTLPSIPSRQGRGGMEHETTRQGRGRYGT